MMFWCSKERTARLIKQCQAGRFGFWCPLLGAESDSCGENSRWKGPTSRQIMVVFFFFRKSRYSSEEK